MPQRGFTPILFKWSFSTSFCGIKTPKQDVVCPHWNANPQTRRLVCGELFKGHSHVVSHAHFTNTTRYPKFPKTILGSNIY